MFAKRHTAFTFILALLISINAYAKTLPTVEAELKSFKNQLIAAQSESGKLNDLQQQKAAAISTAANSPSPEASNYQTAQKNVEQLKILAASDPSKAGELKNAKFKLTLAERKFKKSNKQLQRLTDEQSALNKQLDTNKAQIQKLESNIQAHEALIIKLKKQQAMNAQKRLKQQRIAMEKLKAENLRLKAKQLATTTAAATASTKPPAAVKKIVSPTAVATKNIIIPNRSTRSTVTLLSNPEEIKGELERFSINVANTGGAFKGGKKYLTIRIEGELTRAITLTTQGGDQYRGESKIAHGDASLEIDTYKWKTTVPASVNQSKMTFLLDLSDQTKPYLVYFKAQ